MIIHDVEQGTPEWHALRVGIPTASQFHRLLTPTTLEPSASIWPYFCETFIECARDEPLAMFASKWMGYGSGSEKRARQDYELYIGQEVQQVGFITNDEGSVGCSPDGLVGEVGGVEFKAPKPANHAVYFLEPRRAEFLALLDHLRTRSTGCAKAPASIADDHYMQAQGGMWICERRWWDVVSWNAAVVPVVERVERNDKVIKKLSAILAIFNEQLCKALAECGYALPRWAEARGEPCS